MAGQDGEGRGRIIAVRGGGGGTARTPARASLGEAGARVGFVFENKKKNSIFLLKFP